MLNTLVAARVKLTFMSLIFKDNPMCFLFFLSFIYSLDFKPPTDVNVKLYSDGRVYLYFPTSFSVQCRIDTRLFPFDTQRCNATFEPLDHFIEEMKLTLQNSGDWHDRSISKFVDNGVWDLLDIDYQELVNLYPSGEYSAITVILLISRRPMFYVLTVIVPSVLISMITLMVFILPAESGEKVSLGINNVLALTLFHQLVSGIMPPTSDKSPLICEYFL